MRYRRYHIEEIMASSSENVGDYCKKTLGLDSKIRFAGKIVDERLVSTARKDA